MGAVWFAASTRKLTWINRERPGRANRATLDPGQGGAQARGGSLRTSHGATPMRFPRCRRLLPVFAGLAPLACAAAANGDPAGPVAMEWNARLRLEAVDDDAFAPEARATTFRLRAGLRMHWDRGFGALLEGEGVAAAGDRHDSGANRVAGRPAIADPDGIELNQALVGWKSARAGATVGRQRLLFANQRWVGNSGWRQNEQAFDGLALEWTPRPGLVLRHAWLPGPSRCRRPGARSARA